MNIVELILMPSPSVTLSRTISTNTLRCTSTVDLVLPTYTLYLLYTAAPRRINSGVVSDRRRASSGGGYRGSDKTVAVMINLHLLRRITAAPCMYLYFTKVLIRL